MIAASRARTKSWPLLPAAAEVTCFVTSVIEARISACIPGHVFSSSREAVMKPSCTKSLSPDERSWTHSTTQWWLVKTSPDFETTEAEQPVVRRTEAACTRSSHFWSSLSP